MKKRTDVLFTLPDITTKLVHTKPLGLISGGLLQIAAPVITWYCSRLINFIRFQLVHFLNAGKLLKSRPCSRVAMQATLANIIPYRYYMSCLKSFNDMYMTLCTCFSYDLIYFEMIWLIQGNLVSVNDIVPKQFSSR